VSIVDDLPAVKAIDAELVQLAERQTEFVRSQVERSAEFELDLARWRRAAEDAAVSGRPPPTGKPTPPPDGDEYQAILRRFVIEREQLLERRAAAIANAKPEIDRTVAEGYAHLIEEAAVNVSALRDIASEIGSLLNARHIAACAEIECRIGSGGTRPPTPPTVDVESIVRAVTYGADLLHVDRQLGLKRIPQRASADVR